MQRFYSHRFDRLPDVLRREAAIVDTGSDLVDELLDRIQSGILLLALDGCFRESEPLL